MPRGKNYVNQGKGVSLQASKKSKASQMIVCQYGTGCTRSDCIYRHPYGKDSEKGSAFAVGMKQSREPCMAYLAGMCTFSDTGCRKRHPPPVECQRLIEKYSKVNCRFGDDCLTKGCLYLHPSDEGYVDTKKSGYAEEPAYISHQEMAHQFPPLGSIDSTTAHTAATAASVVSPPGAASRNSGGVSANAPVWTPSSAPRMSSWKPSAPGISSREGTINQQQGMEFSANAREFQPSYGMQY